MNHHTFYSRKNALLQKQSRLINPKEMLFLQDNAEPHNKRQTRGKLFIRVRISSHPHISSIHYHLFDLKFQNKPKISHCKDKIVSKTVFINYNSSGKSH